MSLQTRLSDLITAVGTDYKTLRTWLTGSSTGTLASLTTTDKTSIIAAINETKAGNGTAPAASEVVSGIAELATQAETNAGTDDFRIVTPLKFQTRLAAYAQPLAANLTTLAGVASGAFGRTLLTAIDAAAAKTSLGLAAIASSGSATDLITGTVPTAVLPASTALAIGAVELATDAEATTGTDTVRATTPANVAAVFTARIATSTALGSSNTLVPSQNAVKTYADALIGANDAMVYKGVIDASINPNFPAANAGDTYRISVAGKVGGAAGVNVEVGDTIMATLDGSIAGTQAAVGANWNITQSNIDGAVIGPVSSVAGDFASFSGTTGKVVANSGISLDTATALGTSNVKVPSQNAVKVYADTKQTADAELTAIAGLVSAADTLPYFTGSATAALATFTIFGRSLVAAIDAAAARVILSVYSQTEMGNPETDLVALYTTAKA